MRDWKTLPINCTTREVLESFNKNAYSSMFLDYVTGTIMNNGLLFTGKETIEGTPVNPLVNVVTDAGDNMGIVQSNTIFDNFRMYFRKDNEVIELNNFPVDLTAYADNKPHFLYFKQDRTYRVSDYIFGQADEVLIGRLIIGEDSRWRQFYIMAQRAGTPMYSSGEEFYDVEGIYVKSPKGLELSHTDGTVKRSGIEFTDPFSPDLYRDTSTSDVKVPIRYTNLSNEVDYDEDVTYEVDPNKYMTYDFNSKKKSNAQERIRNLFNATYGIDKYVNDMADALAHALTITTDHTMSNSDLVVYIYNVVYRLTSILAMVDDLITFTSDSYFNSIDLTRLNTVRGVIDTYAASIAPKVNIDQDTITRMRNSAYVIITGNSSVCADPLEVVLRDLYDAINMMTVGAGELKAVPAGKHTIQRILWDIYEKCFILQYGDKVYDTFEDALESVGEVLYPTPFGRLLYIPLAVFIVKQGCTDISLDSESIVITKKVIYADSEQEGFADYVARAMANKALEYIYGILDGTYPAEKANLLKHTDSSGRVVYDSGDYFLNYDNLTNRITLVNNLTESTYNSKHALSAYQGYVLNQNKLALDGSQAMTGTLQSRHVVPVANATYDSGSSTNRWRKLWTKDLDASGNANVGGTLSVTGATSLRGGVSVTGNISATGTLTANGKATLKDTQVTNLTATGNTNLKNTSINGSLSISGGITNTSGAQFVVTGPTGASKAKTAVRLEAGAVASVNSNWSSFQNGTVAVCW